MASLHPLFRQQFVTNLVLPAAKPNEPPSELMKRGHDTAISLLQDFDDMIRLNPLVIDVKPEDFTKLSEAQQKEIRNGMQGLGIDLSTSATTSTTSTMSPSEWKYFQIVDRVVYAFGLGSNVAYQSALRTRVEGMESFTQAALGTMTSGRFIVSDDDSGGEGSVSGGVAPQTLTHSGRNAGQENSEINQVKPAVECFFAGPTPPAPCVVITENVTTRALIGLHVFIAKSIRDSHRTLHERLKEEWEKKMAE